MLDLHKPNYFVIKMNIVMRLISFILGLVSLFLFSTTSQAQLNVKLNVDYVFALGDFKQNIKNNPLGGGFSVFKQIKESDFMIGVDFNNYYYNRTSYQVDLTNKGFDNYEAEQVEVDLFHKTNIFLRYLVNNESSFTPYFEGRFGPSGFASFNVINDDDINYHNYNLDFHGIGFTGGLGTGIMIKPKKFPLTFDFNVTGSTGNKMSYKGMGNGEELPRPNIFSSSPTHIMARAGVIFQLNGCCNYDCCSSSCDVKTEELPEIF